jgi:hypothetical protein
MPMPWYVSYCEERIWVALSSPRKALRACWQCVEAKFGDQDQTYLVTQRHLDREIKCNTPKYITRNLHVLSEGKDVSCGCRLSPLTAPRKTRQRAPYGRRGVSQDQPFDERQRRHGADGDRDSVTDTVARRVSGFGPKSVRERCCEREQTTVPRRADHRQKMGF